MLCLRRRQISFAVTGVLVLMSSAVLSGRPTTTVNTNIVFILVDDQGYSDLGCYGATDLETPHIDAMARGGVRFTDYYAAAPICSPSRAGLLTGCYPRRVGLATWVQRADSQIGLHPDELTIAELLKSNGYATACIGKWHLGFREPFLPQRQGFDEYFGLLHNLDPVETVYFDDQGGVPLLRGSQVVQRPADVNELTEVYTDEAIDFMRRNRDQPFFLYLAHTMLHWPYGVSERFRGSSGLGDYEDAVQELDHHVGRIFAELKRLGIDRRTIVVYASDNGRRARKGAQEPLRGRKLSTYEGGIRVPCIAWGPGIGLRQGHESPAAVRAMDWYPTLATLANIQVPEGRVIDGRDISPLLTGETDGVPSPAENRSLNAAVPLRRPWDPPLEWREIVSRDEYHNAFFYHGSQGALVAVRWDKWKLFLNPTLTLYDLEQDPGETTPVGNGTIARKLRGMAVLFQEEMRTGVRDSPLRSK
jgi:arylsulfatase A-like enzyme